VTFLIGVVGSVYLFPAPPPVFQSTTTVKIEERKTFAGLLSEWIVYNPGDLMASQTKIIMGFPIMKKTALRLKMINDDSPISKIHSVINRLQNKIITERVDNTNIIRITATSYKAKEAKDFASTVADIYVEENLLEKTKQARSTRKFIEEQLSILEDRLKKAEDRLKAFEEETGEVVDIKIDFKKIAPIYNKIADLKIRSATLAQRYTNKHPKIKEINEEIRSLERQVDEETENIPNISDPKGNPFAQKLDHARLGREVEVNKKLYMMFKEKLEEARINEAQKVGDVSIVDPAALPATPINNQDNMNMILICAATALLIGIGIAFILESMDTSIGTIEDIERVMKLPVLGVVSSAQKEIDKEQIRHISETRHISKKEARETYIRLLTHYLPKSLVSEACRNVRTSLKLGPSKKLILVTSAGTQEGKTTILINLGLAVAQTGAKTLLVSSDLRRPAVAKTLGMNREPGITELISGAVNWNQAIRNISDIILGISGLEEIARSAGLANLWVLPCGKLPSNPAEILESSEWALRVNELKERFDYILFDSPPVLPVTDASIIAAQVDSVVLCYELGRISRNALMRAKTQLESVGAHISGVVLNQIKSQARAMEPYPYYTSYKYRYYRDEHTSRKNKKGEGDEEAYPTAL
jgi:tyrosine-protein kinase Etk/Wzc